MMQKGIQTTLDAIIHDIEVRDTTDYLGIDAVNWKADDAIEIDTSVLTIDEQTTIVYKLALEKINV